MPAWEFQHRNGAAIVALSGDWHIHTQVRAPEIAHLFSHPTIRRVAFDASRLGHWDTVLVAFLWEIKRAATAAGVTFDDSALPRAAQQLMRLLPSEPRKRPMTAHGRLPPLAWMLAEAIAFLTEVGESAVLLVATAVGSVRLLLGRARFRGVDLLSELLHVGPRAVAIVGTVNFLVGAILAFIGAAELRDYAAQSYVPNLVGVAAVRELTSIVTAIVMAGRTGGSYAARLASMQGNDEIAALRVIGIPINDFLILPKVVALCLSMPILYLVGSFVAILGGLVVSTFSLGFIALQYLRETLDAVPLGDFMLGTAKSISFAVLIGTVSCRMGLKAARSARAVGDAATNAVVANIVGIITLDAMFALIMDARGN
jgi:phospholipid/cholesterol/gamma-HCH transport system permease protein